MRHVILVALLASACGNDDGGGSIPIEGLSSAVINAVCNEYVSCGVIDDNATCRTLIGGGTVDQDLIAAVNAGKVIYHADKASQCLALYGGSCDRNAFSDARNQSEACDQTFEGTVGEGGQCALDEECISQDCNVASCPDACCQGTCVGGTPPVKSQVGGACQTNSDCLQSYCDTTTSTCAAYKATGAACQTTSQCAEGSCTNLVCTLLPDTGEACSPNLATACRNMGDVCSMTTMTCVAAGLTGDPCMTGRECSPLYYCDGTTLKCKAGPLLGDSCNSFCFGQSYCDGTTHMCVARKADGMTCQQDNECTGGNCDSTTMTCTTPPVCI